MSEKRIQNSLQDLFQKHRIIFWYDADQEWREAFEGFQEDGVAKLTVEGNEFGTKVRVLGDEGVKQNYPKFGKALASIPGLD